MKLRLIFRVATLAGVAAQVSLAAPYQVPSVANRPTVVSRPGDTQLRVPAGFHVEEYASGLEKPRIMVEAPGGEILVAESVPNGRVSVMTGKGASPRPLIEGLDRPYGMTFWKEYLYVAEPTSLKRYRFDAKAVSVGKGEEVISMGPEFGKGHWTRSLTFDPKGSKLYLGVGSEADFALNESERRATIWRCNPDGSDCTIFARGLRNPTSLSFHPSSNILWVSVQERDGLGDDLAPDFLAQVKEGGFYGWPYAYFGPNEDPRAAGKNPELVKKTIKPEVSLGAHTAVIDWKFYSGKQFPAKYQGGALVALHGSSNRAKRVGYSVVFVPFNNGRPSGPPEDFLAGWMLGADKAEVWGRPTGVTVLKDGSVLVSDDGANKVWRVSYQK